MNAVIYTRVSTEDQAKPNHYSLDAQKRLCTKYADENQYKVVQIFEDAGKSATTIKGRPALNDMILFIQENKTIDAVIVQDTDRFARNTYDHLTIKAILQKNNVKLISISQLGIDDSPEGNVMDTMIASFNQFQSQITARKTKKGLEQKANTGWLPTIAPPGYKNVEQNGKKIIVIDNEKAPFIKRAYELYISGNYGIETINDMLYEEGYRTITDKKLQPSKLYYILENPMYYGDFRWGGKIWPGKHEPIVTKETWDLAQEIRRTRTLRRAYERKHQFLLSSLMFCKCGRRLTAEHHVRDGNKVYSYYHCTRGRKCTESVNIRLDDLEKQVEEEFKKVQFSNKFYDKVLERLTAYYQNYKKNLKQEMVAITAKQNVIKNNINRIEDLLIKGTLDEVVYKKKYEQYKAEFDFLDQQAVNKIAQQKFEIGSITEIFEFSKNIYRNYKKGSFEVKRMYLNFFWEKFIVQDKKIIESIPTKLFEALRGVQRSLNKKNLTNIGEDGIINPIQMGD